MSSNSLPFNQIWSCLIAKCVHVLSAKQWEPLSYIRSPTIFRLMQPRIFHIEEDRDRESGSSQSWVQVRVEIISQSITWSNSLSFSIPNSPKIITVHVHLVFTVTYSKEKKPGSLFFADNRGNSWRESEEVWETHYQLLFPPGRQEPESGGGITRKYINR